MGVLLLTGSMRNIVVLSVLISLGCSNSRPATLETNLAPPKPVTESSVTIPESTIESENHGRLYVTDYFEQIRQKPQWKSPVIGLIRAGQSVRLQSSVPWMQAPGVDLCAKGWYPVEPRGFACLSARSTLDGNHNKLPQAQKLLPTPDALTPFNYGVKVNDPNFKVAWSFINSEDEYVSPDNVKFQKHEVVPHEMPKLQGLDLTKDWKLPVAYAWMKKVAKYRKDDNGKMIPTGDHWDRQSFIQISGPTEVIDKVSYLPTSDKAFIKKSAVTVIMEQDRPEGVKVNEKWIAVRVTHGFLVAYEGDKPVFATAMSPGKDGLSKKPKAHITKIGKWQIGWKLTTATMDGEDDGKKWSVAEVPFTQYFKDGLALHGAWWHNNFGLPMSHGCVNLSPADAKWLFSWTEPALPKDWWAVTSYYPDLKGTIVDVKP